MATNIQFLRSTTKALRPDPLKLSLGTPMVNVNTDEPGLFFRDSQNKLFKVGPVHVGPEPPNHNAVGTQGNCRGELWIDLSAGGSTGAWKWFDGANWQPISDGSNLPVIGPNPPANPNVSDFWYDTANNILFMWEGSYWLDVQKKAQGTQYSVQYYKNGEFAGENDFLYDPTTKVLDVPSITFPNDTSIVGGLGGVEGSIQFLHDDVLSGIDKLLWDSDTETFFVSSSTQFGAAGNVKNSTFYNHGVFKSNIIGEGNIAIDGNAGIDGDFTLGISTSNHKVSGEMEFAHDVVLSNVGGKLTVQGLSELKGNVKIGTTGVSGDEFSIASEHTHILSNVKLENAATLEQWYIERLSNVDADGAAQGSVLIKSGNDWVAGQMVAGSDVEFQGTIDVASPAPATPKAGDLYVQKGANPSTAAASWTGIAGEDVNDDAYIIYGDNNGSPRWFLGNSATTSVQSDWDVSITSDSAYIKNKPTALSAFTNDVNFITASGVPQSDWDEANSSAPAYIANKPDLSGYALKGEDQQNLDQVLVKGNISGEDLTAGKITATKELVTKGNKVELETAAGNVTLRGVFPVTDWQTYIPATGSLPNSSYHVVHARKITPTRIALYNFQKLIISDDFGKTWAIDSKQIDFYNGTPEFFASNGNGIVIAGYSNGAKKFSVSVDGGETWFQPDNAGNPEGGYPYTFGGWDGSQMIIGSNSRPAIKTSPDGITWTDVIVMDGNLGTISSGDFESNQQFATYNGTWMNCHNEGVVRSVNGGVDWEILNPKMSGSSLSGAIGCVSVSHGTWMVGSKGYMYRSIDGGENWSEIAVGYSQGGQNDLLEWVMSPKQGVWVTGMRGGNVFKSDDDGLTWTLGSYPLPHGSIYWSAELIRGNVILAGNQQQVGYIVVSSDVDPHITQNGNRVLDTTYDPQSTGQFVRQNIGGSISWAEIDANTPDLDSVLKVDNVSTETIEVGAVISKEINDASSGSLTAPTGNVMPFDIDLLPPLP